MHTIRSAMISTMSSAQQVVQGTSTENSGRRRIESCGIPSRHHEQLSVCLLWVKEVKTLDLHSAIRSRVHDVLPFCTRMRAPCMSGRIIKPDEPTKRRSVHHPSPRGSGLSPAPPLILIVLFPQRSPPIRILNVPPSAFISLITMSSPPQCASFLSSRLAPLP
jgi:hypothetical protein